MNLSEVVADVAAVIVAIDKSGQPFRNFQLGAGPYGEPQLIKLVAEHLRRMPRYARAQTKRTPDLLIPDEWAVEFKIARPFGDNGKDAENWSVNLLHPYPGNVSVIGDCYKLCEFQGPEHRAVLVVGYEHDKPKISLSPLIESFEAIVRNATPLQLSDRIEVRRENLTHPVHQTLRLFAWEVLGRTD
jgi:hypothetical protein